MPKNLESKAEQTTSTPRTITRVYSRSELPTEFKKWQRDFRRKVIAPTIRAYQDSQRARHSLYDRPIGYSFA